MNYYQHLMNLSSCYDRVNWLHKLSTQLSSKIVRERFQPFYRSVEWRRLRRVVIMRDEQRDMGCSRLLIKGRVFVHHICPASADSPRSLLDPTNLITVSYETHTAIHYGVSSVYLNWLTVSLDGLHERVPGDTILWEPLRS